MTNGSIAAYDLSAGAEGEGQLPLPGVKSPQVDLRIRGVAFRGRPLPDVNAHATLGATIEAQLATSDGRLSANAVVPARGGFEAEATLERFDLSPLAALLPPHLADFTGEVSGHFAASQPRSGPHVATASVENGFVSAAGRRFSTSGARASVRGDTVDVEGIELRGDDGSLLRISGRGTLDGSTVEGSVRFEIPDFSAFPPLLPPAPRGRSLKDSARRGSSRGTSGWPGTSEAPPDRDDPGPGPRRLRRRALEARRRPEAGGRRPGRGRRYAGGTLLGRLPRRGREAWKPFSRGTTSPSKGPPSGAGSA